MAIIIIHESDLDNNTIKVANKKVTVPGAEIAVLDSYDMQDNDTHYVEKKDKYLKHVETGVVWPASIAVLKERAAPRNEELTADSVVEFNMLGGEIAEISVTPRSAISGQYHIRVKKDIGDIVANTGIFAQYANAKEANAALTNEKLTFTTNEYFANNVEGRPKILATTFELPYPAIPYDESTSTMQLYAESHSGDVYLHGSREELDATEKVEKTYSYKFRDINGREYEGTKTSTSNRLSSKDFEPSLEWYMIEKAEYSVQPFTLEGFFFNKQVAPSKVEVQNLVDRL